MKINAFATIFREDLEYISRAILDYPNIETGGELFGYWNNLGMPVIQYVTGPSERCYRTETFFKQDLDFLSKNGEFLFQEYGLQHIGTWHSHHQLGLAQPSSHDSDTMVKAIESNKLSSLFMVLGNITKKQDTTVKGFLYKKNEGRRYTEIPWYILENKNPFLESIYAKIDSKLFYLPQTKGAKLSSSLWLYKDKEEIKDLVPVSSWITSDKGKEKLKKIIEWINEEIGEAKMYLSGEDLKLLFPKGGITFPINSPDISILFTFDKEQFIEEIEYIIYKKKIINYINEIINL